jgi:hypothetical protein
MLSKVYNHEKRILLLVLLKEKNLYEILFTYYYRLNFKSYINIFKKV